MHELATWKELAWKLEDYKEQLKQQNYYQKSWIQEGMQIKECMCNYQ